MSRLQTTCALIIVLAVAGAAVAVASAPQPKQRAAAFGEQPNQPAGEKKTSTLAPEESVYRQVTPMHEEGRRAQTFFLNHYRRTGDKPGQERGAVPASNLLAAAAGRGGAKPYITTVYKRGGLLACGGLREPSGWACVARNLVTGKELEVTELAEGKDLGAVRARVERRAKAWLPSQTPAP